jgi:hypothetical protein
MGLGSLGLGWGRIITGLGTNFEVLKTFILTAYSFGCAWISIFSSAKI